MGLNTIQNWLNESGDSGYPINVGFYTQNHGPWFIEIRGGRY